MWEFIPWGKLKNINSFKDIFLFFSVTFYIVFIFHPAIFQKQTHNILLFSELIEMTVTVTVAGVITLVAVMEVNVWIIKLPPKVLQNLLNHGKIVNKRIPLILELL